MREIHEYLVAQSEATSYNYNMNETPLDIVITLILLSPLMLVCVGLLIDLFMYDPDELVRPVNDR